jgi:hypothetical protein
MSEAGTYTAAYAFVTGSDAVGVITSLIIHVFVYLGSTVGYWDVQPLRLTEKAVAKEDRNF